MHVMYDGRDAQHILAKSKNTVSGLMNSQVVDLIRLDTAYPIATSLTLISPLLTLRDLPEDENGGICEIAFPL